MAKQTMALKPPKHYACLKIATVICKWLCKHLNNGFLKAVEVVEKVDHMDHIMVMVTLIAPKIMEEVPLMTIPDRNSKSIDI